MVAGQVEPDPALHRRQHGDAGPLAQDALDEAEVRQVVLDVEDRARGSRRRRPRAAAAAPARHGADAATGAATSGSSTRERAAHALAGSAREARRPSPRRAPSTGRARAPCPRRALRLGAQPVERREEPRRACRRRCPGPCRSPRCAGARRRPARTRPCTVPPGRLYLMRVRQEVQQHLLQPLAIGEDVQRARRPRRPAPITLAPAADGRTSSIAWRSVSGAGTGSSESCSRPASIRLMSSTSLIRPSRWRPARRMCSTLSRCSPTARPSRRSWREAQDRVQRRPQLVAHPRQELALGPVGAVGLGGGGASARACAPPRAARAPPPAACTRSCSRACAIAMASCVATSCAMLDLLRRERPAALAADADRPDQLAADDHRHDHVHVDARRRAGPRRRGSAAARRTSIICGSPRRRASRSPASRIG